MNHPFPEKDFFGHRMTYPMYLEIPEENLPPLPITFADKNLNLAASYVLLYLSGTHDFFHVMIKYQAMISFNQAMTKGECDTTSFSCWCDGYEEIEYRRHRHFIVISPKNHFEENVWPKIKLVKLPKPNYLYKRFTPIVSPFHLVSTIGYLSHRKSQCEFSFTSDKPMQNNHFYFYKTLPVSFKLHLVLLWDGGLMQYLYETKFQNVCVSRLAEGVLTHDGRQWTQKIKDFYDYERGMVLQVERDYIPTKRITPHFLHLTEGRKLYFEKSPENRKLDPSVWLRKQGNGGNCFYDVVGESEWVPIPRDQIILDYLKAGNRMS